MPPVTSSALTPTLQISIKENELINQNTVPNKPKRVEIEIIDKNNINLIFWYLIFNPHLLVDNYCS